MFPKNLLAVLFALMTMSGCATTSGTRTGAARHRASDGNQTVSMTEKKPIDGADIFGDAPDPVTDDDPAANIAEFQAKLAELKANGPKPELTVDKVIVDDDGAAPVTIPAAFTETGLAEAMNTVLDLAKALMLTTDLTFAMDVIEHHGELSASDLAEITQTVLACRAKLLYVRYTVSNELAKSPLRTPLLQRIKSLYAELAQLEDTIGLSKPSSPVPGKLADTDENFIIVHEVYSSKNGWKYVPCP